MLNTAIQLLRNERPIAFGCLLRDEHHQMLVAQGGILYHILFGGGVLGGWVEQHVVIVMRWVGRFGVEKNVAVRRFALRQGIVLGKRGSEKEIAIGEGFELGLGVVHLLVHLFRPYLRVPSQPMERPATAKCGQCQ